jgi:hypothetical protein
MSAEFKRAFLLKVSAGAALLGTSVVVGTGEVNAQANQRLTEELQKQRNTLVLPSPPNITSERTQQEKSKTFSDKSDSKPILVAEKGTESDMNNQDTPPPATSEKENQEKNAQLAIICGLCTIPAAFFGLWLWSYKKESYSEPSYDPVDIGSFFSKIGYKLEDFKFWLEDRFAKTNYTNDNETQNASLFAESSSTEYYPKAAKKPSVEIHPQAKFELCNEEIGFGGQRFLQIKRGNRIEYTAAETNSNGHYDNNNNKHYGPDEIRGKVLARLGFLPNSPQEELYEREFGKGGKIYTYIGGGKYVSEEKIRSEKIEETTYSAQYVRLQVAERLGFEIVNRPY